MLVLSILLSAAMLAVMFVNMHAFFKGRHVAASAVGQPLSFPFTVEGTPLVAERLAAYDGPFVEDGSDDEVTGIAALVLRNTGTHTVTQAGIVLEQGRGQLEFYADTIPPGASVLVLEANRSSYEMSACTACYGMAQTLDFPTILLDIEPCGMGGLRVTNSTQTPLYGVQLLHKQWQEPPGVFVGGISYRTKIDVLLPGQSVTVLPEHYADGYSRIVLITAE